MAKQRRAHSKSTLKRRARPALRRGKARAAVPAAVGPEVRAPARPAKPALSERDITHLEAVALYERGVEAVQRREYSRACDLLGSVLTRFPEEKELHERVRLYLKVCQRQTVPPDRTPRTIEERVYAATLAINAGAYEDGLNALAALATESPGDDHVHYMLAVAHALRQDVPEALGCLQRAIELNPDNRGLAWQDTDLAGLRDHPRFRVVLGTAPASRRDRRDTYRMRTLR